MALGSQYLHKPWLKYYPEGVNEIISIPDKTITQAFDAAAETHHLRVVQPGLVCSGTRGVRRVPRHVADGARHVSPDGSRRVRRYS